MRDFYLVLRVHLYMSYSGVRRAGIKGYLKLSGLLLFYLALAGGSGYGAYRMFSYVREALQAYPEVHTSFLLNILMSLGLATILLGIMSTMNIVYQYMYESEDMAFLISTPLSPRAIFGARFVESYLMCALSATPFGLAPILALGLANSAGPAYYLVSTLGYLSLVGLVLGLTSIVLVVVMRYVPGQRMKQLTMMLGLLFGLGIVLATQFAAYKGGSIGDGEIVELFRSLANLQLGDISGLPHAWMAHAAMRALGTDSTSYLLTLFPLVLLSSAAMVFVTWLAASIYLAGWSGNQETARPKARKRKTAAARVAAAGASAGVAAKAFTGPFWSVFRKESLLMQREPLLWYNFAVGIVVVIFFMMNISRDGAQGNTGGMPEAFGRYFVVFMVLFGASVGGSQLAGSALSREGNSWDFLRSFPIGSRSIYAAKLLTAGLPSVLLSFLGIIIITVVRPGGLNPLPLYVSLPLGFLVISVLTSVMLTADVLTPNFAYRLTTSAKGKGNAAAGIKSTVSSLGSMVYVALMAATVAFPSFYEEIRWLAGLPRPTAVALTCVVFAVETVGVAALGYRLSVRKLDRLMTGS